MIKKIFSVVKMVAIPVALATVLLAGCDRNQKQTDPESTHPAIPLDEADTEQLNQKTLKEIPINEESCKVATLDSIQDADARKEFRDKCTMFYLNSEIKDSKNKDEWFGRSVYGPQV